MAILFTHDFAHLIFPLPLLLRVSAAATEQKAEVFSPVSTSMSPSARLTSADDHGCYMCTPHSTRPSLISQLQQIRTSVIVFDRKCAGALGK